MRQNRIIEKIGNLMRRLFPEARTFLYGAQARNKARLDSDIDLLILLPNTYQGRNFVDRRNEIMDHLYDIEIDEGVQISPLVLINRVWDQKISPFTINVRREGVEI